MVLISIHAPSCEGATGQREQLFDALMISIHAPSCEGATALLRGFAREGAEFQSTPPRVRGRLKDETSEACGR